MDADPSPPIRLAHREKLRMFVEALEANTTLTSLNLWGNPMMNPSWLISGDRCRSTLGPDRA